MLLRVLDFVDKIIAVGLVVVPIDLNELGNHLDYVSKPRRFDYIKIGAEFEALLYVI